MQRPLTPLPRQLMFLNEAYAMTKLTSDKEVYELVK